MPNNIEDFPRPRDPKKLATKDIETLKFLTFDGRSFYISDNGAIAQIMRLIIKNKIDIYRG